MRQIVSLCTGVGGLDGGVIAALDGDAITVAFSEFDPALDTWFSEKHPWALSLGDLKEIDWENPRIPRGENVIVTAGYPCQPFSQAGRRLGEDDPRHLWPYVRDGIAALRPGLVVLENVRGHLSKGFGQVLRDLADIGFDAEWSIVRASDVGAAHRRERLFCLAFPVADSDHPGRG